MAGSADPRLRVALTRIAEEAEADQLVNTRAALEMRDSARPCVESTMAAGLPNVLGTHFLLLLLLSLSSTSCVSLGLSPPSTAQDFGDRGLHQASHDLSCPVSEVRIVP